jgi:hypothetical protein
MKFNTLSVVRLFSLVAASLIAQESFSQSAPRNTFGFKMPSQQRPIPLPRVESTAPNSMLHHWPHATEQPDDEKSLGQLLAQHPELQTHSHMTYYTSSIQVGQRARLQPPGSEFSH